ncbi:DUF1524 domain-containing protein [Paenarthrobacter sp. PH39-S1]|uniref:GmrSD restriction endonuclease domain-containing protein n=1 Tax=Paenarthrobacter sp. PH39-S1 TaxID=3046204 RepID=UPI0024B98A88|nr:DUF1524 domain-containing protein [Paenarthrobacter sp. PH39-S1]MDJ0355672.1 DUF1524 domain-containing protein [Paenarthrobacter sp. PH39-S1]
MNKNQLPSGQNPRLVRKTGHLAMFGAGTLALLLSGCGGSTSAAEPAALLTPAASASPTPSAIASAPSPTTSAAATDMDPLDPDTVPVVTLSGVASPKAQPAYGTKALDLLAALPVKGRAPKTGYGRTEFGQAWADVDRNGCDTRNDILKRDLTAIAFKAGTGDCLVLTGSLHDPYTATAIAFTRGTSTSSAVQIDHVVALSDAWQKGAQQLTLAQRTALANDPLNLLAVDGPTNQKKSDGDAATWLPPVKAYRCDYVARQISVKATYGLWVTQAEHDAMSTILGDCAGALAPTDQPDPVQPAPVQPPAPVIAQAPVQEAAPVQPAVPAPGVQPAPGPAYYANCTAVRAAGAAPIRAGQPGYRDGLDRDGDGIGCE